ncbi:DNA-directed RNA polymerase subunit beta' [Lentisphaera araneosa HTCC2155]|uniref:DNA-directed RNA polymerase subunit beta' n=1 Tax=Lentisphaera araneosa HTCC2155 TaxID=313628 RepID=A6DPM8_9BACT|nr:DNA-directed RNA polymerase subunit beta' [Lentisphaera araneosa]EDM26323.1 DNA-directed RNA polymerase subunit beta' [Lentisphaera araneosa HTCC2155]
MENDIRRKLFADAGSRGGTNFSQVTINLANPDTITSWSKGEVKNPETINYRTFKPEKGGLFCEKIFGPTKDWECSCGKFKRIKHKGIICDRCGVEVTKARVRRERMGHIDLAVPVTHIWFFKCMPSRLGMVLDMTARNLEKIIYYEDYIVTNPGDTPLLPKQILTDAEYRESKELYGDDFEASMGASAVKELLSQIVPEDLLEQLKGEMAATRSKANHKKIAKRMRLMEGFIANNSRPEWMIIETLPVIPPDLRPLVPLDGGRFATSDLNDLYRRVINRNNRLKNLLHLRTPDVIVRNEKRMLQEAVDSLLDNGRHGRAVTGASNRQLKSLSDMLKGKQGRFRQNLLGKRVDYSGRSVIVVGPELKLHQCGIPKQMAMVLFEPFIIRKLKDNGVAHTVRAAKKMIERGAPEVWDVLESVTKGHPVMLNRAPTLHRLSIQAFDPVLIEGKALRIHPLVCTAYNADFDGDQMAVHVPLSNEAQLECKLLLLSPNNILSPANGKPLCTPTQDMTLGCYYVSYLSKAAEMRANHLREFDAAAKAYYAAPKHTKKEKRIFDEFLGDMRTVKYFDKFSDVLWALEKGSVKLHEIIKYKNPDFGTETTWGDKDLKFLVTTPGRCVFHQIWDDKLGFLNKTVTKKTLSDMINDAFEIIGRAKTVEVIDELKKNGFAYATKSGFSVATDDMIIPDEKQGMVDEAMAEVEEVRQQYKKGVITNNERYNKIIDIWTHCNSIVAKKLFQTIELNNGQDEINSVFAMMDSGARGSKDQIRQLAGMRGLMAKPSGEIIERPILSSFREGLTVLEYFISSHGARKGLADTALKTADSGYMTRKLVDVSQDVVISEEDCGTAKGIQVAAIRVGDEVKISLIDRIVGRVSVDDIHDPLAEGDKDAFIVKSGEVIDKHIAKDLEDRGIEEVRIRSVLTCESDRGVCSKCYGILLASTNIAQKGDAVGIIAAQSIGEPGTQLTMRTFHVGGTASTAYKQPMIKPKSAGTVTYIDARLVGQEDGSHVVVNKNGKLAIVNANGVYEEEHQLVPGTQVFKKEGDSVKVDEMIAQWDPYNVPIITETKGRVHFIDLVDGVTLKREINAASGEEENVVLEHRDDLHPQLSIVDAEGNMLAHYSMPNGAHIIVEEGFDVVAGEVLAKIPRQSAKTKDITGGLPRVAEIFEARLPKNPAVIAPIDGYIEFGRVSKGKQQLTLNDPENNLSESILIPTTKRIIVHNGEFVRKGSTITDGSPVLQDMLEVCGAQELQEYLVNEVQDVYRTQGVEINDKHVEIVVRQMLRKIRIADSGSTAFLAGEQVDKKAFEKENERVLAEGGQPAEGVPVLLGVTKASLETDSFISAASFQDTTRILTDAATLGKVDTLEGFKENVIMGHLIPAGTGIEQARDIKVVKVGHVEIVADIDEDADDEFSLLQSTNEMLSLD